MKAVLLTGHGGAGISAIRRHVGSSRWGLARVIDIHAASVNAAD
jgi:hypothetical protein